MLNDISNFRFYAHKVLPLVYDDSLSYYEFLCKVVAKLNEVIDLADQQNSTIEEIVEDVEDFEAETNTKYNQFVAQIEADLEAFETEMRTAQSDYETEISGEMTEFEGTMQNLYDEFLENYQRTFGIQDSFGTSTTDAISQACVSQLIDYTGDTPFVKGDNLPIDDTTTGTKKLWSSDKIEDEIEEVNTDLGADITALEGRMDTAESDIDTLESGVSDVQSSVEALGRSLNSLETGVSRINTRLVTVEGKVSTLETSVGTLSSDVTSLSTQVTQMDTDVDNLQDDVLELRNDVDTNTGKIADIEDNIDTLDTTVGIVRDDLDTAESDIATLQSNLSYESGRIDGLNTRMGEAETDINELQDDVSEAQANIGNLTSRMGTAEDDIDALEGRMTNAEDVLNDHDDRLDTAEDDIDNLESRMTTAESDIDSLEENKANKVGEEDLLISGGSKGLLYGKINDGEPYNYRVTAGGKSVGNLKKVKNLVGGTLAINQLLNKARYTIGGNGYGIIATDNGDGSITLTGTNTGTPSNITFTTDSTEYIRKDHIYLVIGINGGSQSSWWLQDTDNNVYITKPTIYKATHADTTVSSAFRIRVSSGYDFGESSVTIKPQIIDLTTLFGTIPQTVGVTNYNSIADYILAIETANSGTGVSWLYKYFPILNGGYVPFTQPNIQSVCCSKSISDEHEYNMGHETLRGIYMLDSNGNLYCDPTKNDTKTPNGTITRIRKKITINTLSWSEYSGDTTGHSFVANAPSDIKAIANNSVVAKLICDNYSVDYFGATTHLESVDKVICQIIGPNRLIIRDTAYSTASAFTTEHGNDEIEYELATAITESGTPYTELQICKTDGTEELTDYEVEEENRVVAIPVGHTTEYDRDIAPELNNLLSILPTANGDYLLNVNNGVYSFQSATNRSIETLTPIEKTKEEKTEITSEEIPEGRSEENEELSD